MILTILTDPDDPDSAFILESYAGFLQKKKEESKRWYLIASELLSRKNICNRKYNKDPLLYGTVFIVDVYYIYLLDVDSVYNNNNKEVKFGNVEGYQDIKNLVRRALDSDENYNLLLCGFRFFVFCKFLFQ